MPNLILKVQGNKYVNHSFFRPYLFIYDDYVVYYKRRKIFFVDEISIPYEHISRVNLHKGIIFSKIEFVLSGGSEMVHIKGVWNRPARRGKALLDKKIQHAHKKSHLKNMTTSTHQAMENFEKSLHRLKELLHSDRISKREFEKRRKKLLDRVH